MTPRLVVHVFATFGAGGPQVRAAQWMGHAGAGFRHVVMAMDGHTEALLQVPAGVAIEPVPPPPKSGMLATVRMQRRFLVGQRPDLVLTYNWGAIETVLAARSARLPLVHHEDGFLPEEATRRLRRRNWLRRWALRTVPVIVPSHVLEQIAHSEWGLSPAHVQRLPNGVDLERFSPDGAAERPLVVGTVGGLRPEKDHATLLRALHRLPGVRAAIVGGGVLEPELHTLCASLGIADRVQFPGPVRDTAPSYRGFAVFVLSSRTEQMPIVLLEAMASGLPVVATDVGDVRAILPASAHAFVVPREDPEALARALGALLADAELRRRLGAENREVVVRHFEARSCLERFSQVYRGALRGT